MRRFTLRRFIAVLILLVALTQFTVLAHLAIAVGVVWAGAVILTWVLE